MRLSQRAVCAHRVGDGAHPVVPEQVVQGVIGEAEKLESAR